MYSVILLMILCGGIHSIYGETLPCLFKTYNYFTSTSLYSCFVNSFDNRNDNKVITGFNGMHMANKYDTDVIQIYIHDTNTKFIPANLGFLINLQTLCLETSQLIEIRSKDFHGMQNLEYLSLNNNKLTSLPSDVLSSLTKLKHISIEHNQIKYIGYGLIDQFKNMHYVDLRSNNCINKNYSGSSAIIQLIEDVKENCMISNDPHVRLISLQQENEELRAQVEILKQEVDKCY